MLDEPSLGLSPLLTYEIFQIIKELNEKDGVTILLVEQNVNMALKYAHFAYLMENGRIVRADKPEVLREDEDVKEFYLGIAKEESVKGFKRYRRKVRFHERTSPSIVTLPKPFGMTERQPGESPCAERISHCTTSPGPSTWKRSNRSLWACTPLATSERSCLDHW
jgi:ABC-type multidrug transport system ATPase subunit